MVLMLASTTAIILGSCRDFLLALIPINSSRNCTLGWGEAKILELVEVGNICGFTQQAFHSVVYYSQVHNIQFTKLQ